MSNEAQTDMSINASMNFSTSLSVGSQFQSTKELVSMLSMIDNKIDLKLMTLEKIAELIEPLLDEKFS